MSSDGKAIRENVLKFQYHAPASTTDPVTRMVCTKSSWRRTRPNTSNCVCPHILLTLSCTTAKGGLWGSPLLVGIRKVDQQVLDLCHIQDLKGRSTGSQVHTAYGPREREREQTGAFTTGWIRSKLKGAAIAFVGDWCFQSRFFVAQGKTISSKMGQRPPS